MTTIIVAEKSSQARDLRAALGDRCGLVLAAEGHLLRLAEPEEVNPAWKRWAPVLLKPDDLFPTRPDDGGNKPAKLKAIVAALKGCREVILATDCDREGQLIGQEILEHAGYRGPVRRALFTAQDPKTLQEAFRRLKPNAAMRPLYEAAVARRQADQIFNLSLTRTATRLLLPPGARGVIGIGRVKTPTLAIVCLREIAIREFKPEDYFEVVATATVAAGRFPMRHAPPAEARITGRSRAEAIAAAAAGHRGPLTVAVEDCRRGPPRLFDLPALQKTCGQRWGWTAERTLAAAQELYDGEGRKLITYPRAEARALPESLIPDVPVIVGALTRLRGFAGLEIGEPVIRRGKTGHFSDQALAGVAHHAIIPNVNVMNDLETRLGRLSADEQRLFALICRSYLAAIMPDYRYRQTTVTLAVPIPGGDPATFRTIGRIPLQLGWRAVYGATEQQEAAPARDGDDGEAGQELPLLTDGETATLSDPVVEAKRTQPPPRYNEGTLVDAMQNAWRFVTDPVLRERLKEAKGIGTPATRAEIIKGLKRQNLLAADGKLLVPTPTGLTLFEQLRAAAPALVDPGTTAVWEMRLDEVVTGQADFRAVIDAIAAEAGRLIEVLCRNRGAVATLAAMAVDPAAPATPAAPVRKGRRSGARRPAAAAAGSGPKPRRGRRRKSDAPVPTDDARPAVVTPALPQPAGPPARRPPSPRMLAFARDLARKQKVSLPPDLEHDFKVCHDFLEARLGRP
jgi:DNA topoisomerase-3